MKELFSMPTRSERCGYFVNDIAVRHDTRNREIELKVKFIKWMGEKRNESGTTGYE